MVFGKTSASLMEEWRTEKVIPIELHLYYAGFMDPNMWLSCSRERLDGLVGQVAKKSITKQNSRKNV